MSYEVITVSQVEQLVQRPAAERLTEVREKAHIFEVAVQGPPGPPGLNANSAYEHMQLSAASSWTVNHNLGFKPAVTVTSVGGREMWAEVIHTSANQFVVYFDAPTAGVANCS